MGYTTDFDGQFTLSRQLPEKVQAFLAAIEERPNEIGVFADWLEDEGDARANSVRGCTTYTEVRRLFHGLTREHEAYLTAFAGTRRMRRDESICAGLPDPIRLAAGLPVGPEGAFFVGAGGYAGQDGDDSVLDYNHPPRDQPGLWCQWIPRDGDALVWDGAEKFYNYVEWLQYLIDKFLGPWGHTVDGSVTWQGEDENDKGTLTVKANVVRASRRR